MTISRIESDLLREEMYFEELENGLKIFFMPRKGYTKQYAIFATNYGSNDNMFIVPGEDTITQVPEGIAHFLEHKLFEEPEGSIFDKFSELGSDVNAYTNFTSTCYLFSSTDRFFENLSLLIEFVQSPHFTDENVEKEKGIIAQEIRMYDDDPNWKVFFNALKSMYHFHPVKNDIAGTIDSINKITKEDLYKCYHTFYSPQNMIVFVTGDIDKERVFHVIREHIKNRETKMKDTEIKRIYPEEPQRIVQNKIEERLEVSIPLFNIAFKDTHFGEKGQKLLQQIIAQKILLDMLFGKSSDFYTKLYEEGLINNTFGYEYTREIQYGYSMLGGESKNPYQVFEKVIGHLEQIKKDGLNQEDFERVKKKFIGKHIASYNSIESVATSFVAYYFKDIHIFDYVKELKDISFKSIQERFYEDFSMQESVLSTILPKNV